MIIRLAHAVVTASSPMMGTSTTENIVLALFGAGGIAGFTGFGAMLYQWRRYGIDRTESETRNKVSVREVDVEEFKAHFPGGMKEVFDHYQQALDHSNERLEEVQASERQLRVKVHDLEMQLDNVGAQLRMYKRKTRELEALLGKESTDDDG